MSCYRNSTIVQGKGPGPGPINMPSKAHGHVFCRPRDDVATAKLGVGLLALKTESEESCCTGSCVVRPCFVGPTRGIRPC